MKNSIAERVYDFLKNHPPFNMINKNDLLIISKQVSILYFEKGDTLFKKGDSFNPHFYIVRNGAITSFHTNASNVQEIISISDSGDIFGVRPLFAKENYKLTATANEESIVYAIPIDIFQAVTQNNTSISKFLMTAFAANAYDPYTAEETGKIFADYISNTSQDIVSFQTANYSKNPITCDFKTSLKDAAILMSTYKIGCIIVVDEQLFPVGIITNSDIKNKIATGLFSIETPVTNIMSSPVITNKKELTVADGQLQMIKHNIGHLCITKDGTANSKLIGVLTHHDILVTLGNNPSVILKEIKRAKRTKKLRTARLKANTLLKNYLEQNIPISHILNVISQINDAVTERAIEIALKKLPPPPVSFCWMAIGSQGRKEQLLFTDQDNALVFEDVSENDYENTQNYFLELAKLVTKSLNKIGFDYCEANMMASNKEWCKSVSQWQLQFQNWILNPTDKAILLACIFFDYNAVYGNKKLVDSLTITILDNFKKSTLFFNFLGLNAINNPAPLGFFKQFLVDEIGDKKDLFNVKSRALMPLIDAARILTLSKYIEGYNNTAERYEKLAELEPNHKELYQSCSYAFKALIKFKTKQGLLHNNSGKFIYLDTLTKEEKLKLKRCFKPIHEIQDIIKIRFDLKNFM